MYFDLNDEQRAIQETAREFLAARYKPERIRDLAESEQGFGDDDWNEMSDLGWAGLALPEEHGGQGLGAVELAILFEQMGYALAPSPLFSSTVAGLAIATNGSDEQKARLLPELASGAKRATVALVDAGSQGQINQFTMEAREDGDGVVLEGEKVLVADAGSADYLLVATSDRRRHIVEAGADGVSIDAEPSVDSTRRLYSVRLDGVRVGADETLPGSEWMPVFGRGCVMLAAELTGIAQKTLDMAVEYARDRQQFGRPIGAYQGVSHTCAKMLLETENSRSATYGAAWAADADPENFDRAASIAKAYASDAGWHVAAASMQVHGGIGFTWEHDLHLWLKRARVGAAMFGDAAWHRERVAELVLAEATAPVPA